MLPSGSPTPIGTAQSVPSSLMRSNSDMLGSQGGGAVSSQTGFPSLVSPRNQYNNMNLLGNMPNGSSLLSQSFVNGVPNRGHSGTGNSQQSGGMDVPAEAGPLSSVGNGLAFGSNPGSSCQIQGHQFPNPSGNNHIMSDQHQSQHLENQNFQHNQQSLQQLSASHNSHQQQFQLNRGGLGVGGVKLEPQQVTNDQIGQSLRNIGQVKLEPQQLQNIRNLSPVKVEPQYSDQSLFLHQQQQQQLLQMSRQAPQAAAAQINLLHQQRIFQLQQQQQQQQLLKAMPQQRAQIQQQFAQQNMSVRPPVKSVYEPGMCARRLTEYMYQQQHRPKDNNIDFWRKFVAAFFAPHAKKKWCVSMYGSVRQTTGVFPQDVWHCEICNCKPGRGFEATVEVLPRLFKIKYDSGTLEELLYVDMPREYENPSGQIVLDYAKAIQESVFEQLRVVRDGRLRIVFSPSPELKICSWEFCARRHEELIPRRLLIPQVSQLGAAAQKYRASTQNASNLSVSDLQSNCNMFVASAHQLAKALEVPLVNDLGYTKRYVRCLQISEVVNSMKDLIDYSRDTGTGPIESLAKFPRRTNNSPRQSEEQQQQSTAPQNNSNNNDQLASTNGISTSVSNSHNNTPSTSTIAGLLHQNSMNSRHQYSMSNTTSPYGAPSAQIPSPGSSTTMPSLAQPSNNHSPFQSPTPSSNNPPPPPPQIPVTTHPSSANSPANMSLSGEPIPNSNESQSSVQKIIQNMMMSSSSQNDSKNINTGFNSNMVGNGPVNNVPGSSIMEDGFGNMSNGYAQSAMVNGMRASMGNNNLMSVNGRIGIASMVRDQSMNHHQQQDLGNQMLSGLGAVNGFNNLQFDWKSSP